MLEEEGEEEEEEEKEAWYNTPRRWHITIY